MKKDLEYNSSQEYQSLPDEYLQGAGKTESAKSAQSTQRSRSITWKKMIFTVASVLLLAHIAELPDTISSVDTPDVSGSSISGQEEPVSQDTERKDPTGEQENQTQTHETQTQTQENQVVEELPIYLIEDRTCFYTVYNDSYDFEAGGVRVVENGFLFEALLLQGMNYPLPEPEPMEGFQFLGWVLYYDKSLKPAPSMGMAGDALDSGNVCYVKPVEGSRDIEVHAAWRGIGENKWPYLLTLDANGGTIENESAVTYDAVTPLYSDGYAYLCAYPIPVRAGYTFAGWYTQPNGSGEKVTRVYGMEFYEKNGDEYDFSSMKDITLYAAWAKN